MCRTDGEDFFGDGILKVARTIADLEAAGMPGSGADAEIKPKHLLEASGYRFLDKI